MQDVSLGDMGELRKILNKARSAGKILGAHKPQLWASEFSWDSKGPDQRGVPMNLLSRWISETVYRLNKAGVSTLLWFGLRDRPFGYIQTQSGFWYCGTVGLSDDGSTVETAPYNSTERRPEADLQCLPLPVRRLLRERQGEDLGQAARRRDRQRPDLASASDRELAAR